MLEKAALLFEAHLPLCSGSDCRLLVIPSCPHLKMDVVGSLAALIAVAGLTKEVGSAIKEVIQGYREAPREIQLFSNQVELIQLELECLVHLRDDIQQKRLQLSPPDLATLESLSSPFTMTAISAFQKEKDLGRALFGHFPRERAAKVFYARFKPLKPPSVR